MKKWMPERFFARLRGVFAAGCLCGGLLGLPSVTWAQTVVDGGVVSVKTIEVAEGESQTLEPQSGLDQVCKMGQGILVVTPESVADWSGTLYVMEGTLDVGAVRALPKLAFSEGTALLVTETREDDGEIFLAESTGAPSVRLQRLNGGVAEGAEITVTVEEGGVRLSFAPSVDGEACWMAFEFNGSLENTGASSVRLYRDSDRIGGVIDYYYGEDPISDFRFNEPKGEYDAVYTGSHPYATLYTDYPQDWTCVISGTLPQLDAAAIMMFGAVVRQNSNGNVGIMGLITGSVEEGTVLFVKSPNRYTPYETMATMKVPNAFEIPHLYVFVKEGLTVRIYLDGLLWSTYTLQSEMELGRGLQLGSVHGGVYYTGIQRFNPGIFADEMEDPRCFRSVTDTMRFYDYAIGPNAIAALVREFPYLSPNIRFARTITERGLWCEEEEVWTETGSGYRISAPVAGSDITLAVEGDVQMAVNLSQREVYNSMSFTGSGSLTLTASKTDQTAINGGITVVGVPLAIEYGALSISGGPLSVLPGGSVSFDLSAYPIEAVTEPTFLQLTGITEVLLPGTVSVSAYPPELYGRTMEFGYDNASKTYRVIIGGEFPAVHTVTFVTGEEGRFVDGPASVQQVVDGGSAQAPNVVCQAGYELVGWSGSLTGITADVTLQAVYRYVGVLRFVQPDEAFFETVHQWSLGGGVVTWEVVDEGVLASKDIEVGVRCNNGNSYWTTGALGNYHVDMPEPGTWKVTLTAWIDSEASSISRTFQVYIDPAQCAKVVFDGGEHGRWLGEGAQLRTQYFPLGWTPPAEELQGMLQNLWVDAGWVFAGWVGDSLEELSGERTVTATYRTLKADLHVDELSAPTLARTGETLEVRWRVGNTGNPDFQSQMIEEVRLVRCDDPAQVVVLGRLTEVVRVPRDGSVERSVRYQIPAKGLAGQWWVVVETALETAAEHGGVNSAQSAEPLTIEAVPLPDLSVKTLSGVPERCVPGEPVEVTFVVQNTGAGVAHAPWQDGLYLVHGGERLLLGTVAATADLAPGAEAARTLRVTLPELLPFSGDAVLFAKADAQQAVVEAAADEDAEDAAWLASPNTEVAQRLYLALEAGEVAENRSEALRGTARRSGEVAEAASYPLTVSGAGEAVQVPAEITFPAQARVVEWSLAVQDDTLLNGTRQVAFCLGEGEAAGRCALAITDNEEPSLTLSCSVGTLYEGGGLAALVTVTRDLVTDEPLSVYLSGVPTSQCVYPSVVEIPAGEASVEFGIGVENDEVAEVDRDYTLQASAIGHRSGSWSFTLKDDDVPGVRLTLFPEEVSEGAGVNAIRAVLARSDLAKVSTPVTVKLEATPAGQAIVPAQVVIPANCESVAFMVGVVDNDRVDGTREVTLDGIIYLEDCGCSAKPAEREALTARFRVTDNDSPALALAVSPATLKEGVEEAGWLTLSHNSVLDEAMTVTLAWAGFEDEIALPQTVRLEPGESSVRVPITTLDDGEADGDTVVVVSASVADGSFAPASTWLVVTDRNLPDLQVKAVDTVALEGVTGETLQAAFSVVNGGFAACDRAVPYAVHLVKDRQTALTEENRVDQGILNELLPVGAEARGITQMALPEEPGTYLLAVKVNPDASLTELDAANNVAYSEPITVAAAWTVAVQAAEERCLPGETVHLVGTAQRVDGAVAAQAAVEVYLLSNGFRRTLSAVTDAAGAFEVCFTPSAGEAGHYVVGAGYPGTGLTEEQDAFDVLGLARTSNAAETRDLTVGDRATIDFRLRNLSQVPLTGLAVQVGELPGVWEFAASLPEALPGESEGVLTLELTAIGLSAQEDWDTVQVEVTTAEGCTLSFPFYCHAQAQTAQLRASPAAIDTTMTVGAVRTLELTVFNDGQSDTGEVSVLLPEVPWLRLLSAPKLENLPPQSSAQVVLELAPAAEHGLALNAPLRGGSMAFQCADGGGLSVPLAFTPVSTGTGTLSIDVTDDATWTLASAPHLAGAAIRVTNPYTGALVASGQSDAQGRWENAELPPGLWQLRISADGHEQYADAVEIAPGRTTQVSAFLHTTLISYSWEVVRTEIEDSYEVRQVLEYNTSVPAPIVKVSMPEVFPNLQPGESWAFVIHLENTGLIQATEVQIIFPELEGYTFRLQDNDFTLPAKSSRDVVGIFSANLIEAPVLMAVASPMLLADYQSPSLPCESTVIKRWTYQCGPHNVEELVPSKIRFDGCQKSTAGGDEPVWPIVLPIPSKETERPIRKPIIVFPGTSTPQPLKGVGGTITQRGCNTDLSLTDCLGLLKDNIMDLIPRTGTNHNGVCSLINAIEFEDMFRNGCASRVLTDNTIGALPQEDRVFGELAKDAYDDANDLADLTKTGYTRLDRSAILALMTLPGRYTVSSEGVITTTISGLKARLYVDSGTVSTASEIVLAFAGTEKTLSDILTDAEGGLCNDTMQYLNAKELARKVASALKENQTLTLVGHSLGGGEASYACMVLAESGRNVRCRTYNAMGLCANQIPKTGCENASSQTINYRTSNDAVSRIGFHNGPIVTLGSGYSGHSISNFGMSGPREISKEERDLLNALDELANVVDRYHMANDAQSIQESLLRDGVTLLRTVSDIYETFVCLSEWVSDKMVALLRLVGWQRRTPASLLSATAVEDSFEQWTLTTLCDALAAGEVPKDFISTGNRRMDEALMRLVLFDIFNAAKQGLLSQTFDDVPLGTVAEETVLHKLANDPEYQPEMNKSNAIIAEFATLDSTVWTDILLKAEICFADALESGRPAAEAWSALRPQTISVEAWSAFYENIQRWREDPEAYNERERQRQYCARIIQTFWKMQIATGEIAAQDYFLSTIDAIIEETITESQQVCAKISFTFSQTLAMTREAFDGTLTMTNGHGTLPVRDLKLDISVLDEAGVECRDLFVVFANGTGGAMSEGSALEGGLSLPAGATGSAMVRFIPSREAAPTVEKAYRFGGTLTYTDPFSGETATVALFPVTLTVSPSPYLKLDYFVQRDVYGDDPLTPETVEASMPAEIAVLIRNEGAGEARQVRIASVQPSVVLNEKGLAATFAVKDYSLDAAALNGNTAHLGLGDVALGDIPGGESRVAQWWLTASVDGHFTELSASVTPLNSWNTPDTALVNPEVGMHRLIRSLALPGEAMPYFLTCEQANLYGTPDTVYAANGQAHPLREETRLSLSAPVPLLGERLTLTVTVEATRAGWFYGSFALPGAGRYRVLSVARDGQARAERNAWTTNKVFRDGLDPLPEERLHLADLLSASGSYTYTLELAAKPTELVAVEAFDRPSGDFVEAPIESLVVRFTRAVDPASFTADALSLTFQGQAKALSGVTIAPTDEGCTTFCIDLPAALQGDFGRYELVVSTAGLRDWSGQLGEASGKAFVWSLVRPDAPYILSASGAPTRKVQSFDTLEVTLSTPIVPETMAQASFLVNGQAASLTVTPVPGDATNTRFTLSGLEQSQAGDGTYTLSILCDQVLSTAGIAGSERYDLQWTRDTTAPAVTELSRQTGLQGTRIRFAFTEALEPGSLTLDNLRLTREPLPATAKVNRLAAADSSLPETAKITALGDGLYELSGIDAAVAEDGIYTLTLLADGLADEAGNLASGSTSLTWSTDVTPPDPVGELATSSPYGSPETQVVTAEASLTLSGTVSEAGLTLQVLSSTGAGETLLATCTPVLGERFSVTVSLQGSGNLTLLLRLADPSGNTTTTALSVYRDTVALVATLSGEPDGESPAEEILLDFSEAPDPESVTLAAFSLLCDGAPVSLAEATLTQRSETAFVLGNLAEATAQWGEYTLAFDAASARKRFSGKAGIGSVQLAWSYRLVDRTPPVVEAITFDDLPPEPAYVTLFTKISARFSEAVNVPELIANGLYAQAFRVELLDEAGQVAQTLFSESLTWDAEALTATWFIAPERIPVGVARVLIDGSLLHDAAGNLLQPGNRQDVVASFTTFAPERQARVAAESYACPTVADFDGDGVLDLLVGEKTGTQGQLRLYRNIGNRTTPLFGAYTPLTRNGEPITFSASGCQGLQATPGRYAGELVFGLSDGSVYLWDRLAQGEAGEALDEPRCLYTPAQAGAFAAKRAIVACFDLDSDGVREFIVGGDDGRFRIVRVTLRQGDDAQEEIEEAAFDWVVDGQGVPLQLPQATLYRSAPAFADVNGDAVADLLSGDAYGNLWAFLGNGDGTFASAAISLLEGDGTRLRSRPACGDLTGDGIADLFIGYDDGSLDFAPGVANFSQAQTFRRCHEQTPEEAISPDFYWEGLDVWGTSQVADEAELRLTPADGSTPHTLTAAFVGSGTLSFTWGALGEDASATFVCLLDGVEVQRRTGSFARERCSFSVTGAGSHTLAWHYQGTNTAILDDLHFEPDDPASQFTASTPVPVAYADLRTFANARWKAAAGDYESVANATAANGRPIWENCIVGLDAEDPKAAFQAKIAIDAEGRPVVTWEPALNGEGVRNGVRTYTVFGATSLEARDWAPVAEGEEASCRFFRVRVEMPTP